MAERKLILCNCLESQTIDPGKLEEATGIACSRVHHALCMEQSLLAAKAIKAGGAIIACQQERHFFEELADELDAEMPDFVDLRDRAGWSQDERPVAPKMAALVADAMLEIPPTKVRDVESAGLCLILGDTAVALGAARQLCDVLNVTVLLEPGAEADNGDDRRFDVVHGRLAGASGAFGDFQVRIDAFQERIRGGRGEPVLTSPKDGAQSVCDIILDLSGGTPLFSAHEKREGYLRADPKRAEARLEAIVEASQLVGTFEKPLYVRLDQPLCAHSRAQKTGCTRCLDLCPAGAISPAGDHVDVDAMVCAGCGACSAVCPSGAISYDAPPVEAVFKRLEVLAGTWRSLSKDAPRLLVHDAGFGAEAIRLSARYGRGFQQM
ncbi:4Fe-4S dicluster domain-containing protein [Salaquimonas pukyongi]|uniref:4Fe-4S dicluster domain-containing protein n=1 Tax=Salaquimonas pukyongi TaxID=2712698 RepID=UPI0019686B63|nr:4Fe-4S dicluster domain-containing protein [Salaquimonas pukyongi]